MDTSHNNISQQRNITISDDLILSEYMEYFSNEESAIMLLIGADAVHILKNGIFGTEKEHERCQTIRREHDDKIQDKDNEIDTIKNAFGELINGEREKLFDRLDREKDKMNKEKGREFIKEEHEQKIEGLESKLKK